MDKKTEYFIKKIERGINDGNYTEAKIYYDKAILYLGQIPEVIAYKSTIDSEIKRTKPNKQDSEDISGIRKRKPINEALIILPIMALVIIGYLFYFFTNTYPMHHITKELSGTWYQGDLSSSSSEGVYLEFKSLFNEIYYRTSSGNLIAKLEYEIVNGKEITVDGYPVRVEFDGDYVTFSPSFVDTSEKSVWRSNREYTSSDKTGNFSKDDTLNSSDLSHNDSSTNSNSNINDSNSGDSSSLSGGLPSGETENNSSANTSTGDNTNVSDNANNTACANGHTWKEATCTEPATCAVCGITSGSAKGHTWKAATCTKPATCAVCGISSGSANGHDMCITRCTQCDYTDFSKIAKTYTEIHSYDLTTGINYDVQNVIINSDGILSFCFNGNSYSIKLVQTTKYLPTYEYMAKFDCYVNGKKVSDAEFQIDKEYYMPRLTWKNLDGCNFYFYAE